jgi:GTP diphosphokinase / guanosine-3',5'-bis(diphosphate) 3'-diphosphatase
MGLAPDVSLFFETVAGGLAANDISRVEAAWVLAEQAHAGQIRQSGEPYVTHPLAVASILYEVVGADAEALCAALLHDVVEDSNTSLAVIVSRFGEHVARIVDGVSKLDSARTAGGADSKEDTLRKLVAAGGRDWRVFAVKLCDRLHNMRTLASVGRAKQRRVAMETRAVFVPLARYVGFLQVASELESLSLRWIFPWRWAVVVKWAFRKTAVDRLRLHSVLTEVGWGSTDDAVQSSGRTFHELMVRSFKLLREDRACRALFSVPTVFGQRESIERSYEDMARLHRRFGFVPGSFSSHAAEGVVTSKLMLQEHALVAEFAFFFPPVARSSYDHSDSELLGDDDFAAVASTASHPGDFTRVLRDLVEHTAISVFSPKGRRLSLPRHATGLDFAFAIHTDLGLRAKAVRVNGLLREVGVELTSGDIVEVVAAEHVLASPEWEAVLRSPRSRAKLRHWLRESARDNAAVLGRRLLADAAGLVDPDDARLYTNTHVLQELFGVADREGLWRKIGAGELSAFAVAARLNGSGAHQLLASTSLADARSRLLLDGGDVAGIQYCPVCMPLPGDDIVAVASFAGAKVHRLNCPSRSDGRASNSAFTPMWASRIVQALPAKVRIKAKDRRGLLADCAAAVAKCEINVVAVTTKSLYDATGEVAVLDFTVMLRSRAKLETCLKALSSIVGVSSASRFEPDAGMVSVA